MKNPTIWAIALTFSMGLSQVTAQEKQIKKSQSKSSKTVEEDDGPIMYQFEPNYTSVEGKRKVEIEQNRALIDSLDISDRKRRKLMRVLYSSDFNAHLSKVVTVETKLEDTEQ